MTTRQRPTRGICDDRTLSSRQTGCRWWVVLVAVVLLGSQVSIAQPIKPAYNIGDYEYLIGGYDGPDHSNPDAIWGYMDSLGVVIPILGNLFSDPPDGALGVLLDTTDQWWREGRRFMPISAPEILRGGYGRELQLYPFDSVQSTLWPSKFITKVADTVELNLAELDPVRRYPVSEAIYENSGTIGQIAKTIAINAASLSQRTLKKNQVMLSGQYTGADSSRCGYFVVTGHLFTG